MAALLAAAWGGYGLWGPALVAGMYDGTLPVAALNGLIRWQSIHPVAHYQTLVRAALSAASWLVVAGAGLHALLTLAPGLRCLQPAWRVALHVTPLVWLSYLLGVPLGALPYWFWHLHPTPLTWGWLVVPLVAAALWIVYATSSQPERTARNLVLLMALTAGLQFGFALLEGRGLDALGDRLQGTSGHARLLTDATDLRQQGVGLFELLGTYAERLDNGTLSRFPHATRPPGPLLLFWLLGDGGAARAAWLMPLLTALTVVPVWLLARRLLGREHAAPTVVLWATSPGVLLITLHLDGVAFPLVGVLAVFLWVWACQRTSWLLAALSGVALCGGALLSYGLLALAPLWPLLGWALLPAARPGWPARARRLGQFLAIAVGGYAAR